MFRLLATLILALLPPTALGQSTDVASRLADAPRDKLVIGVRRDARPFSYKLSDGPGRGLVAKSGPIRKDGYDGYMAYICDEILKQMLLPDAQPVVAPSDIRVIDVDEMLADDPNIRDRFSLLEFDKIDILCDPATISRDRVRSFAVSPPLFLTGVSYLTRDGATPPRTICDAPKALIGGVGTTNAIDHGVRAIIRSGELSKLREAIIAAMRDQDPNPNPSRCPGADDHGGAIWSAPDHETLAKLFCAGDIAYYVGDIEIIRESVARIPGCDVASSVQRYTADRYAIFGDVDYDDLHSKSTPEDHWKPMVVSRFFELLNRDVVASDSVLDRAYAATFGESEQSESLKLFYWSIRGAP